MVSATAGGEPHDVHAADGEPVARERRAVAGGAAAGHLRPTTRVCGQLSGAVCRFARAYRCRKLRGWAAFGYDELAKQTFYGLRAHVLVCYPGVIVALELTPAKVHDMAAVEDLTEQFTGTLLADRNYWSPKLTKRLQTHAITLLAPYKSSRRQPQPYPYWLTNLRRRIATVFGQLVRRFHAKQVWARDVWHLSSRWLRKILSHTFAVYCCQLHQLDSALAFDRLLSL